MEPVADACNQMMEVENIPRLPIPSEMYEMDIQTESWVSRLLIEFINALAEKREAKLLDRWDVDLADAYWMEKEAKKAR